MIPLTGAASVAVDRGCSFNRPEGTFALEEKLEQIGEIIEELHAVATLSALNEEWLITGDARRKLRLERIEAALRLFEQIKQEDEEA